MKSSLSSTLKALAASSLLLAATVVQAQAPDAPETSPRPDNTPQAQGPSAQRPHHGHGKWKAHKVHAEPALSIPGVGVLDNDVVQSLALTDTQQALLSAARNQQQALRQAHRQVMLNQRNVRQEQLASGTIDPRQALKAMDEQHQHMQASRQQVQEKWLAVWDSLTDEQRQKVSVAFKQRTRQRAEHLQERARQMQQHAERLMQHAQPQSL